MNKSAPGRNYYDALGLTRTCSAEDVRVAFRRRALSTHPDKGGDESEFKLVNQAYDVLKDENSRRLYDACLDADNSSLDSEMLQCILNMLAQWVSQWRPPQAASPTHGAGENPVLPPAIVVRLDATLQELYTRAVKKIGVKVCGLTETDKVTLYVHLAGFRGEPFVFPSMGDAEHGRRGDIIVHIRPVLPENVSIDQVVCNFDLMLDRYVTLEEYLLSDEIDVQLFPGVEFRVPYKAGDKCAVLEQHGLPMGDDGSRGTLYVYFHLVPPDVTDDVRALFRGVFHQLKGPDAVNKGQ